MMSLNQEKMIDLVYSKGVVSLKEVLENLKVLKKEKDPIRAEYLITRINKDIPWPAPYEAGQEIDGSAYHCCSYSSIDDDFWPEDTKQLNVYLMGDES